jgi:hypothetical protein
MGGVPKQVANAIRSTAFLLEELEELTIHETIRLAFDSQITEFTLDMKLLVEDTNGKIDQHIKASMEQVAKATAAIQQTSNNLTQAAQPNAATYASALIKPPPNVNPKLAAKESLLGQHNSQKLKTLLNKEAKELGLEEGRIQSLILQKDGSALIEVDSDAAAKWFTDDVNRVEICSRIGEGVTFKHRAYNVIAFNAPSQPRSDTGGTPRRNSRGKQSGG